MALRRKPLHVHLLIALLGSLAACFATTPVHAAPKTFTVTSNEDSPDKAPGNGTCLSKVGGCTLRAAIMEANTWIGTDEIVLPAEIFELTRAADDDKAAWGDLDITRSVTIRGAGSGRTIIDGNEIDRVFQVFKEATVTISEVQIKGGDEDGSTGTDGGGGIYNSGRPTLKTVVISGNAISSFEGNGGGIYNSGALALTDVTVDGNETDEHGGGIANTGSLEIRSTTLSRNVTILRGGGIWNQGEMYVSNSTISDNWAGDYGGGIYNDTGAEAQVENTTILTNRADGEGDGIGDGGGVWNGGSAGSFMMSNNIIAYNLDTYYDSNTGQDVVRNSDCRGVLSGGQYSILYAVQSICTVEGEETIADPFVTSLRNNGGATRTHALLPGSPAIDAALGGCYSNMDQRGSKRVDGDGDGIAPCDIGSYEYTGPAISRISPKRADAGGPAFTLTVTGVRFQRGLTVVWNGANRETTYVSPTTLKAKITKADIATPGNATVNVYNSRTDDYLTARTFTIDP